MLMRFATLCVRQLGRAALVLLAVHAVAAPARGELLRVGKAVPEAFSFVPLDIGVRTGLFKKYGLDIEIANFGGDAKLQQAMAADSIDIALGSGPGLAFIVKGSPVRGIAAMAGPPLLFALVVRNDDTIKTVGDLKGRKIGVSTVGSVTSWIISEVSRQRGWGFGGIEQVPIGENASRVAAVRSKALDGCIVDLASALNYVQKGEGKILLRFGDLVQDFIIHVIFATDKAIAEKPEALRGFLAGWFETIAFMQANRERTIDIVRRATDVSEALARRDYDELRGMFNPTGRFNPEALKVLSRSFVEMGMLPAEPDVSKLITDKFLPAR
jgi:ABC-type nitrate/sulfonate/bicarbonate transport system substrate-binding protein